MTPPPQATPTQELRLAPESVEAVARRVAELVAQEAGPSRPSRPRRLLTAADVSEWWGVERSWVYANADRLGAKRLGAGERPRLRFDPDEIAERLGSPDPRDGQPIPPIDPRRSPRIAVDSTSR